MIVFFSVSKYCLQISGEAAKHGSYRFMIFSLNRCSRPSELYFWILVVTKFSPVYFWRISANIQWKTYFEILLKRNM